MGSLLHLVLGKNSLELPLVLMGNRLWFRVLVPLLLVEGELEGCIANPLDKLGGVHGAPRFRGKVALPRLDLLVVRGKEGRHVAHLRVGRRRLLICHSQQGGVSTLLALLRLD